MLHARQATLLVVFVVSACAVYDESLLGGNNGGGSSGRNSASGSANEGGTASPAGNGGVGASGATTPEGGDAGQPALPLGGAGGETGGTDSGGGAAGEGDGGAPPSGGTAGGGSGGTASGGMAGNGGTAGGGSGGKGGSGGTSPVSNGLIDDMQHGTATYANAPYAGVWSRAATGDMVWTAADVPSMFAKRSDSATNQSLHLVAGCPATGTCASSPSDVELIATLNSGSAVDISAYSGISFYVNRASSSSAILRVAFDDGPSHLGSSSCSNGTQADCGVESEYYAVAASPYTVAAAWTKYQVPFSSFAKNCGWMCTRQNALNLKEVYSLRFRIDRNTSSGAVNKIDVELDDLYFYK